MKNPFKKETLTIAGKVYTLFRKGEKCGLKNESKKVVIPCKFDEIAMYNDVLCKVFQSGKFGLADLETGALLIPCEYENIEYYEDNLYYVKKAGKLGIYNAENQSEIIPCEYDSVKYYKKDLYEVQKAGKVGIYSAERQSEIIPCEYDSVKYYKKDLYEVQKAGKVGIYSAERQSEIVPCEYEQVEYIFEYLYQVQKDGKLGMYRNADDSGKEILPCEFDKFEYVVAPDADYFYVYQNGYCGFYRVGYGEFIVPLGKYSKIEQRTINFEKVKDEYIVHNENGCCGLYNSRAKREIIPSDKYVKFFTTRERNYWQVEGQNGKIGLFDSGASGEEIIPCEYDKIYQANLSYSTLYRVERDGKCGLYDIDKKREVIPCQFASEEIIGKFYKKDGVWVYCGRANSESKTKYIQMIQKSSGRAFAQNEDGKWGMCDIYFGQEEIPCMYDEIKQYELERRFYIVKRDGETFAYDTSQKREQPLSVLDKYAKAASGPCYDDFFNTINDY